MSQTQYEVREEYRYYAFISYSHKDKALAKWVQTRLETYRLPTQIRKKHIDLPKRIGPIFRDETDLAGSVLEDALRQELTTSQYLIVICSPHSAASTYVNDEIRHFLSLGRHNRIIPLIAEGIPFSGDPATECFPPALRQIDPVLLGISLEEHGRQDAFLRLVATLLKLSADEVIMRERKRAAIRKLLAAGAGGILALTLGITWWYNTEHSRYYNAYTYEREIPVGLYKLSSGQRSGTSDCYRITRLRNKVIRLETVNSQGVPISPVASTATSEYPVMKFEYDDAGTLIAVIQCDETGTEVSRKKLSYPADGRIIVEFSSSASGEAVGLSADVTSSLIGSDSRFKSQINRQDNFYDEEGRMIRSMYYWYNTFHPVCDENGVYGKSYTYNDAGLIENIHNLDKDGNLVNCKYGWSTIFMEYDDSGNLIYSCYYSADGAKAVSENGIHGKQFSYDSAGNLTEVLFVNISGEACNCDEDYARQSAEYNDRGFLTAIRHFNAQGNPVTNDSGVHAYCYDYDDRGRARNATLLSITGRPVAESELGYAAVTRVYDENGNQVEQWLYDVEGKVLCVRKMTYENDREVAVTHEDGEGNPILFQGYCTSTSEYNSYGYCSRDAYYDTQGNLVLNGAGYAYRELEYDEYGNIIQIRNYGPDGQPCLINRGYASAEYTYVDGRCAGASYFGTDGNPILLPEGYHRSHMEYNTLGACVLMEYYGTDGALALHREGYAVIQQDFDDVGNTLETRYYGTDYQPVLKGGEYHKTCNTYDSANNLVLVQYYGTDGKRILQPEGYAVFRREFDAYGNSTRWQFFGVNNEPVLYNGEYHEIRHQWSAYRHLISLCYYDTQGNPINVAGGFAMLETDNDAYGNVIASRYYDADHNPVLADGEYFEVKSEFDLDGNPIRKAYYGTDGKLITQSKGHAIVEYEYDIFGNTTCVRYFGTENQPIVIPGDGHEIHFAYDAKGNLRKKWTCGTNGQLIVTGEGYALVEFELDDRGNVTAQRFFGAKNNPILLNGEYHAVLWDYDENGNEIRAQYFDTEGNLIVTGKGYAVMEREYDEMGRVISVSYFGENYTPILMDGEYHQLCVRYDAEGNIIWGIMYDTDGSVIYEME